MKAKVKRRIQSNDNGMQDTLATDRGIQDVVQMEKRNHDARSGIDQVSWTITNLAGAVPQS